MAVLSSLEHVVIAVKRLEPAVERYTALLGHPPGRREEASYPGTVGARFTLQRGGVELVTLEPGGGDWLGGEARGLGIVAMVFAAPEPAAMASRLKALGVPLFRPGSGEVRPGSVEGDTESEARFGWALPRETGRGLQILLCSPSGESGAAPVPESEPGRVTAIDHVVIHSPHVDATRALYRDTLGLRLALERSFVERGVRLLFFRVGGVTVEIASRLDAAPRPREPDRSYGLAYQVGDADAAHARLVDEGFEVSEVRAGHKPGTRVFTVKGPTEGVATLFLEPAPKR